MRIVKVEDGYIVAEVVMFPRVSRELVVVANLLGGRVNVKRLSPVFPEKKIAKAWGKYACGDVNVSVRLPEWIVRVLYTVRVDELDEDGSVRTVSIPKEVRYLMRLYGAVKMNDFLVLFHCMRVDNYVRIVKELNKVARADSSEVSLMKLMEEVKVWNDRSVIELSTSNAVLRDVIEKYAISRVDKWYYVRKSEAPVLANELLEVVTE